MRVDTGKENAEYIIRLVKLISPRLLKARYAQWLSIIQRFWKVLKRMLEWSVRRMVGKILVVELI